MQLIWNQQNNEKLFAIDESALFDKVKAKSKDANWILNFFETVIICVSVFVIYVSLRQAQGQVEWIDEYIMAAVMFFVGMFPFISRIRRKKNETHFEPSILGEVNKAISRIDHIISYCRSAVYWCLIPIGITRGGIFLYHGSYLLGVGYLVFCALIAVALRWELRKIHQPKRQDLEALKELILAEN